MAADATHNGNHPTGGVSSIRWVLQGLEAGNRSDLAVAMATVAGSPGWAFESTPDMPGTIWEAWTGDATHSDGSKNHPMFTGGIGVWIYESALGLRFKHAIQRTAAAAAEAEDVLRKADALVAASPLGFDPRVRLGFTSEEAIALCEMIESSKGSGATLQDLLDLAAASGLAAASHAADLVPTLTAAPSAALMRSGQSASGWLEVPQGRAGLSWSLGVDAVRLRANVPPGVSGRLGLPLALALDMMAAGAGSDVLFRVFSVDVASGARSRLFEGALSTSAGGSAGNSSCVSLGAVVDMHAGSLFACMPAAARQAPSSRITRVPRTASWAEMEGEGRIHFDGLLAAEVASATGFVAVDVRWGVYELEFARSAVSVL
jgi:hypothetical protein